MRIGKKSYLLHGITEMVQIFQPQLVFCSEARARNKKLSSDKRYVSLWGSSGKVRYYIRSHMTARLQLGGQYCID